jgi:hypothetical protein
MYKTKIKEINNFPKKRHNPETKRRGKGVEITKNNQEGKFF